MNWNQLFNDFLHGRADAIQAVFSMVGFLATLIGIIYISRSFKQQTRIYRQQLDLNRLSIEKHRREVRPNFLVIAITQGKPGLNYSLQLTNAIAVGIIINTHAVDGEIIVSATTKHNAWDTIDGPKKMHYDIDVNTIADNKFTLNTLNFEDEDGRRYEQLVVFRQGEIYSTFPKLVKDLIPPKTWGYKVFTNNFKKG
ncbi:MAG: hypothetical protein EOP47_28310 [Sphingobacteriaceae bacterium]|nr:MAG: hypothetical protein EOP47_28310 [Sphingobacteriaceae bacterium]